MRIRKEKDFISCFDERTGKYVRSGILKDGKDTGVDSFMTSFPELLDIGIMGHCVHGLNGLCATTGVMKLPKKYQKKLMELAKLDSMSYKLSQNSQQRIFECASQLGIGDEYGFLEILLLFSYGIDWMDCETYKDYEAYFENNQYESPFFMKEYSKNKMEDIKDDMKKEETFLCKEEEIYVWYYNVIEKRCAEYGYNISNGCNCLWLLGKVCIFSEDGHIPEYVEKKLLELSEFGWAHMG